MKRAGNGVHRPGFLNYLEILKYYQSELKFKSVYSRKSVQNTAKDETSIVSLHEYKSMGMHWIALYVNNNRVA